MRFECARERGAPAFVRIHFIHHIRRAVAQRGNDFLRGELVADDDELPAGAGQLNPDTVPAARREFAEGNQINHLAGVRRERLNARGFEGEDRCPQRREPFADLVGARAGEQTNSHALHGSLDSLQMQLFYCNADLNHSKNPNFP